LTIQDLVGVNFQTRTISYVRCERVRACVHSWSLWRLFLAVKINGSTHTRFAPALIKPNMYGSIDACIISIRESDQDGVCVSVSLFDVFHYSVRTLGTDHRSHRSV
jgi:hypothetical protein